MQIAGHMHTGSLSHMKKKPAKMKNMQGKYALMYAA